jgi:hypothetical protein
VIPTLLTQQARRFADISGDHVGVLLGLLAVSLAPNSAVNPEAATRSLLYSASYRRVARLSGAADRLPASLLFLSADRTEQSLAVTRESLPENAPRLKRLLGKMVFCCRFCESVGSSACLALKAFKPFDLNVVEHVKTSN